MNKLFSFLSDLKNYPLSFLKFDLISGLTVALVALPQTMAYALIAGVPPQYWIYASITPVIFASLFWSSKHSIAWATNAISMLLFATFAALQLNSLPDDQKMPFMFLLALIVWVIQILLWVARLWILVNYVSHSVVIGFTTWAWILIAFNQIKNLVWIKIPNSDSFIETVKETFLHLWATNYYALWIWVFTIVFIFVLKRFAPKLPWYLVSLIFAALLVALLWLDKFWVKTIWNIPQSLPPFSFWPLLSVLNLENIQKILSWAFVVAFIWLIEAIAIAKSISTESKQKIDSDQEFIWQWIWNVVAAFFSWIPWTWSFSRSAVNFKSWALTRFSWVFSAIFVCIITLTFAPLAKFIPMTALAWILMVVAYSMVNKEMFLLSYRATIANRIVMLITMISTLLFHLSTAIYIWITLSIILFLRTVSTPELIELLPESPWWKLIDIKKLWKKSLKHISILQLTWQVFFGSATTLDSMFDSFINDNKKVIILRMKWVLNTWASWAELIHKLAEMQKHKWWALIISWLNETIKWVLKRTWVYEYVWKENFTNSTNEAISLALKKYLKPEEVEKWIFNEI